MLKLILCGWVWLAAWSTLPSSSSAAVGVDVVVIVDVRAAQQARDTLMDGLKAITSRPSKANIVALAPGNEKEPFRIIAKLQIDALLNDETLLRQAEETLKKEQTLVGNWLSWAGLDAGQDEKIREFARRLDRRTNGVRRQKAQDFVNKIGRDAPKIVSGDERPVLTATAASSAREFCLSAACEVFLFSSGVDARSQVLLSDRESKAAGLGVSQASYMKLLFGEKRPRVTRILVWGVGTGELAGLEDFKRGRLREFWTAFFRELWQAEVEMRQTLVDLSH